MKRAVALSRRKVITAEDLSDAVRTSGGNGTPVQLPTGRSLKEKVEALEKHLITEALQARRYNQLQAAKMLGLSRQGLMKKVKRYGIRAA
jgi:transcriptional regulator with PAS, ATPase and Fis domain